MSNVSVYAQKLLLDYMLRGVTTGIPAAWGVNLSLGSPTSTSASEIATGSGVSRQTGLFAAAASPAGSASNSSAMTFGPFSSACSVSGIDIWDTSATGGNHLMYGLLSTPRTLNANDSLVIGVGQLVITMA